MNEETKNELLSAELQLRFIVGKLNTSANLEDDRVLLKLWADDAFQKIKKCCEVLVDSYKG